MLVNIQNFKEEYEESNIRIKQFSYEILESIPIFKLQCNSLAFDNSSTLIIAGFKHILKIFTFNSEKLALIPFQNIYNSTITCLEGLKQYNLFFFAFSSGQFQLSSNVGLNNGKYIQKLKNHSYPIYYLKQSNNSESIISCDDWKVSFWIKRDLWQQIYIYTNNTRICAISFNEIGDKLILSDYNKNIFTFIKRGIQWIKLQSISLGTRGQGICFIGNQSFIVQPEFKTLYLYKFIDEKQGFIKQRELKIKTYGNWGSRKFKQTFIQDKKILINKDETSLNFLQISDQLGVVNEFQIQFYDSSAQSTLNKNGSYLITWDNYTKCLKMYKYQN
ncbi:unnamed protein product [Paramecium sonneborni]|uniref:Uncharacterized protein n=1 Tax=Paramecium sonneborni TaxID=65129 RepID=A0A8S1RBZ6_9CILI|nr:unnamed protein product [Paramecium sonneborni]